MRYFRIKNWEKYQHRDHKKSMPWIKLHTCILEDPKMFELSPYQFGVWCKLMLLCARVGNELSTNQSYLKSMLGLSKPFKMSLFEDMGLIEKYERAGDAPSPLLDLDKRRCVPLRGGNPYTSFEQKKKIAEMQKRILQEMEN